MKLMQLYYSIIIDCKILLIKIFRKDKNITWYDYMGNWHEPDLTK